MEKQNNGALCVLIAAIAFSLGGVLIKFISYSSLAIASGRCIFSSLVFTAYFLYTKKKIKINKTIIIGAIFGLLNMLAYIVSNKLTTAANAIVLEYTSSIFIILFEYYFFKKIPSKLDTTASACIMLGIGFVVMDGIKADSLLGIGVALVGGAIYAVVFMANSFQDGDSITSMYLAHMACAILFLPVFLKEVEIRSSSNLYLIVLGLFQAGLGYLMLTIGTSKCKPLTASLIASLEPILNPILVAIFYHEKMTALAITGAAIVLISNIVYNILSNKESK